MNKGKPVIELTDVGLVKDGKTILQNISWNVKNGQHWAIIGQNGSGKTMLLKTVTGYQWPTNGVVKVLGKKFGEIDLRVLRTEIGWVSSDIQQKMQQNFSALDVVLSGHFASIGLYEKVDKKVYNKALEVMDFMQIHGLKKRLFPLLSFGEQKRTLIARSLMNNPTLLILDEPCTGLDLRSRESFLEFVQQLIKKPNGPTIILVTHHIEEIVPGITHVLCLKKGKVIKSGKKEGILKSELMSQVLDVKLNIENHKDRYISHIVH